MPVSGASYLVSSSHSEEELLKLASIMHLHAISNADQPSCCMKWSCKYV
jgi:hypothetical protein